MIGIENFPTLRYEILETILYYNVDVKINNYLNVLTCGHEVCEPDKPFPVRCNSYYVMHYIVSGRGTYSVGGNVYTLGAGDIFVVCPNTEAIWKPDQGNPWEYLWISFTGLNAENYMRRCNISPTSPVIRNNEPKIHEFFLMLEEVSVTNPARDLKILSITYNIFSELIRSYFEKNQLDAGKNNRHAKTYIAKATYYIHEHYSEEITLHSLAVLLGLTETYVSHLFKKELNLTFSAYLSMFRITKASNLMAETDLSIREIAEEVGYRDSLYFSRAFRKYMGQSPSEFRSMVSKKVMEGEGK